MVDRLPHHAPTAASVSVLRTKLRLRTGAHRYAFAVLDRHGHAHVESDPGDSGQARSVVVGPSPIRVLLFGAGVAIGYGVSTRSDALDGALTRFLATRTGRGVILDNRAVRHLRLNETVESLGAVGTHTYHVAIWCPSFADGLERLRLRSWRTNLRAMIRGLRATEAVPLLLTHIPVPLGYHPFALLARPWVHRINAEIDQVAGEFESVSTCDTIAFTPADDDRPLTDAEYFAATAERLAPALMLLLHLPAAEPAGAR